MPKAGVLQGSCQSNADLCGNCQMAQHVISWFCAFHMHTNTHMHVQAAASVFLTLQHSSLASSISWFGCRCAVWPQCFSVWLCVCLCRWRVCRWSAALSTAAALNVWAPETLTAAGVSFTTCKQTHIIFDMKVSKWPTWLLLNLLHTIHSMPSVVRLRV